MNKNKYLGYDKEKIMSPFSNIEDLEYICWFSYLLKEQFMSYFSTFQSILYKSILTKIETSSQKNKDY